MSDKELLAQIALVAGAINKHKNTAPVLGHYGYNPVMQRGGYMGAAAARGRGRGRGAYIPSAGPFNRTLNNTGSSPAPTPYSRPAVRPPVQSRHLRLVNSTTSGVTSPAASTTPLTGSPTSSSPTTPTTSSATAVVTPAPSGQWIQSKRKNMSMMNPDTFKKTMIAKEKSIKSSKDAKIKARIAQAKRASDLRKGIVTVGDKQYNKSRDGRKLVMRNPNKGNVVINGVVFEMDPRGNKLVRKAGSGNGSAAAAAASTTVFNTAQQATLATPKQFSVDGVKYVRTTSGNLVRASLVKNHLLEKRAAQQALKMKRKARLPIRARSFCKFFTRFGQCSKGIGCPFIHSRNHLAICKKFLRGVCAHTAATCRLSHVPSYHTTPACQHFQRAACTKEDCPYPHIKFNPQAPICRPFATEGWCDAGIKCKDRHVWICPDFGTPAGCKRAKCGLAHVANGGIKIKKSAEEIEKERQQAAGAQNSERQDPGTKAAGAGGRYMDGMAQSMDYDAEYLAKPKVRQFDENFIPLDLGSEDEEEAEDALLMQQEEGLEEEEEEEAMDMEIEDQEEEDEGEGEGESQESDVDEEDIDSDRLESEDDNAGVEDASDSEEDEEVDPSQMNGHSDASDEDNE